MTSPIRARGAPPDEHDSRPTVPARHPERARRTNWPRRLKPAVFAAALLPLALLAWRLLHDDLGADPIRKLEIETGLWTLRFLAATLAVTPLRLLTKQGWPATYRRMLGLFAFFYATVHLSLWIGVDWFFDVAAMAEEIVKHKYILVGMATYLLLVPLAVTSTKGWVRRLGGARWNRLHRLAYVAAVGGTVHYLWAVKKDTLFPLVYLGIFGGLLGARVVVRRRVRAARKASGIERRELL